MVWNNPLKKIVNNSKEPRNSGNMVSPFREGNGFFDILGSSKEDEPKTSQTAAEAENQSVKYERKADWTARAIAAGAALTAIASLVLTLIKMF